MPSPRGGAGHSTSQCLQCATRCSGRRVCTKRGAGKEEGRVGGSAEDGGKHARPPLRVEGAAGSQSMIGGMVQVVLDV